jgi:hypothetical protein
MILPGYTNRFKGVVGGTFDTLITLYQGVPASVWGGIWQSATTYATNTIVVGANSVGYLSSAQSTGVNPINDLTGTWSELTPLDLTEYTAAFQINPPNGIPQAADNHPTLGGAAGTVAVNITASATSAFTAGDFPCYLQITDGSGDVYYPIIGQITFVEPI